MAGSDYLKSNMRPALVVLAGGVGKRYGGYKQLEEVGPSGETILEYSVYDALQAGFGKVVFIVGSAIEEEIRSRLTSKLEERIEVRFVRQELNTLPSGFTLDSSRTKPWGTGHAVWVAQPALAGPFAVINADDYYGPSAFSILGENLSRLTENSIPHWSLLGYDLNNTLSDHGPVSRGICEVDSDGFLLNIKEREKIQRTDGSGVEWEDTDGTFHSLNGDETVSMNLFGFGPEVLNILEGLFISFLNDFRDDEEAEFFLPTAVDEAVRSGLARTRVLITTEKWLGITYRDDVEEVKAHINEEVRKRLYPEYLWR